MVSKRQRIWFLLTLSILGGWLLLGSSATAQGAPSPASPLSEELAVRGGGWELLGNPQELLAFGLDLVTALVLATLLIFHPVETRRWKTVRDFDRPKLMFLFAVVGLAIGFLVVHHGYVIGFILFGLGGLLRFKMDVGDAVDTTRAIIVTLIGLCSGLSLPVMATAITLATWATIYLFSRSQHFRVEVKFKSQEVLGEQSEALREAFFEKGWKCIHMTRSHSKAHTDFLLSIPQKVSREDVSREVEASLAPAGKAIKEWHLV